MIMSDLSRQEDEWQAKATASAIAGARKIAQTFGPLTNTPVGRLSDTEWGWLVAAIVFGWISARAEQAIAEGREIEAMIRSTGLQPNPCDVAVVWSILPELADKAAVDWSQPLSAWSKNIMTNFLMLAWRLIGEAEAARDRGKILTNIKPEFNEEIGDPIPF
jgi:hypothetical protein